MTDSSTAATRRTLLVLALALTWIAGGAYLWHGLDREWVPHDEGAFGESVQRVLAGELPHRDFDELYTGGLSYLNALAFTLFGAKLLSLRLMLYGFFLLWVPVLFYTFSRFAGAAASAALTLLAVVWSVPNYPAAVPSWYNLFFATATTAAFCRYLESERRRWLFLAGLSAGLSCLFKIVGLYLVAASALFLVFLEQTRPRRGAPGGRDAISAYTVLVGLCVAVLVTLLLRLVASRLSAAHLVHFVLPGAAVTAVIGGLEWRGGADSSRDRLGFLYRISWPFLLGLLVPLLGYVLYYAAHGAVGALWDGVFVRPVKRVSYAAAAPPPLSTLLPAAYLLLLLVYARQMRGYLRSGAVAVVTVLGAAILLLPYHRAGYLVAWFGISQAIPLVVVTGVVLLARSVHSAGQFVDHAVLRARRLMLVLTVLAMCALVQFPFAAPVYFTYVAPLLLLATTAVIVTGEYGSAALHASLIGFYALFAILRITPSAIYYMGVQFVPDEQRLQVLMPERAGLKVPQDEAVEYDTVIAAIRAHARGTFMYATPDSPQVYYLAGLRNPTGTLFDFFDEPRHRTSRILTAIEARKVSVIALNRRPYFSGPVPRDLADSLAVRFPHAVNVDDFVVRWRE